MLKRGMQKCVHAMLHEQANSKEAQKQNNNFKNDSGQAHGIFESSQGSLLLLAASPYF